jgi:hypothetical protein
LKTWLDEYIKFSAETWDMFMVACKKAMGTYLKVDSVWEKAFMWNQMAFMTDETVGMKSDGSAVLPRDVEIFRRFYVDLLNRLSPWSYVTFENLSNKAIYYFGPFAAQGHKEPLNLQIAPDLAEDFHGAHAPETEMWREVFDRHSVVYLDFPPGTYTWDDQYEVRAVFATNDIMSERDLRFVWMKHGEPMLSPHYPKLNVMVVLMEKGKLSLDNVFQFGFAENEPWSFYGGLEQWNARAIAAKGQDPVEAYSGTMQHVVDLIKLSILYQQTKESPTVFLPQVDIQQVEALRNPKKQKTRLRENSLFKVARLSSPKGRFGRTNQEAKPHEGYQLGHRVAVRGHFRMQAHGPGWSERRLRWIDAFEKGPKDGPIKPPKQTLHVLKKEL